MNRQKGKRSGAADQRAHPDRRADRMSQQKGKRSGAELLWRVEGEMAADHGGHLAEICSVFALISRGVVSGSDLTRLSARLAILLGAGVTVEEADAQEDAELLSEGLRIARHVLQIWIGTGLSLRITARGDGFTDRAIEIARILALPLSACFASAMTVQALRAAPGEGLDEALLRLATYARLSARGDLLEWSAASLQLLRDKHRRVAMREIESALLRAAQAFLRGERVAQRIAPDLLASFAFATPCSSSEDVLIAAFFTETPRAERAMDSPAAALLTDTEMRITMLLITGQSEAVIARQLGVSRETVRTHRKHIYQKVGAKSSADLVPLFSYTS